MAMALDSRQQRWEQAACRLSGFPSGVSASEQTWQNSDRYICSMISERIKTPGIAHVAYLIGKKGEGTVVDPRRDVDEFITLTRKHKLMIKYVIETHRQEDFMVDGETFDIATGLRIVALHTPSHTPESMCYAVYLDDAHNHAWAVSRFSRGTTSCRVHLHDPSRWPFNSTRPPIRTAD